MNSGCQGRQGTDVSYGLFGELLAGPAVRRAACWIVGGLGVTTIFRKTAKGVGEIATRANRLAPRLRTALILVDGTRNEVELGHLIKQQPAETLQELLSLGYIEAAAVVEVPPKRAAEEAPSKRAAADTSAAGSSEKSFAAFRAEAVRAFNDLTGPPGEALAVKMEKTSSREQLAPLLETAYQIIGSTRGTQAAAEFKARFASF